MERADARLRHPSQETLLSVKILRGARVNDPLKMFSAWTGHAVDFCFFFFFAGGTFTLITKHHFLCVVLPQAVFCCNISARRRVTSIPLVL